MRIKTFSTHVVVKKGHVVSEPGLFTHEKIRKRDLAEGQGGMERRGWEIGGREEDGVMWTGWTWLRESWGAKKCDGNGWCGIGSGRRVKGMMGCRVGVQGGMWSEARGGMRWDGKRQKWRAKSLRTPFYQYSIYNQKDVLIIVLIILSHPLRSGHSHFHLEQ